MIELGDICLLALGWIGGLLTTLGAQRWAFERRYRRYRLDISNTNGRVVRGRK